MIKALLFLILGFIFLVKGADFFVDGSSALAIKLKVPPLVVGLTVVAMGTSLPELSVSTVASINNSNSLAISNVLGSNIFNFLVVLGISALLNRIDVEDDVLKRDFPVSIVCAALIIAVGLFNNSLTRISGILFLVLFVIYLTVVVKSAIKSSKNSDAEVPEDNLPIYLCFVFIVGGAVAIKFGGDWVVDSAVFIAKTFGISETIIGLTIVSVGTSLPELVTSLVAAKKGELGMAIGNAVGSNIFNILLILGVASTISPLEIITHNMIDAGFLIVASIFGLIFCITKRSINRAEGATMLALYAGFMVYILNR